MIQMAPAGFGGPYEPRRILQSIAHQNPLSFILTMRSHDAFYTLSTFVFSNGCHSFADHCTRTHGIFTVITLNLLTCELDLGVTRVFPSRFFHNTNRAHFLTHNRTSDNPEQHTLRSTELTNSTGMTIKLCVKSCENISHKFADVENGIDFCECTSGHCPQGALVFVVSF